MRNEILQLKHLGRMPNESINESDSIDELINAYDTLLEQIQFPISFDDAMVLVQIFPENAFYDLQWSLLRLVEDVYKRQAQQVFDLDFADRLPHDLAVDDSVDRDVYKRQVYYGA